MLVEKNNFKIQKDNHITMLKRKYKLKIQTSIDKTMLMLILKLLYPDNFRMTIAFIFSFIKLFIKINI